MALPTQQNKNKKVQQHYGGAAEALRFPPFTSFALTPALNPFNTSLFPQGSQTVHSHLKAFNFPSVSPGTTQALCCQTSHVSQQIIFSPSSCWTPQMQRMKSCCSACFLVGSGGGRLKKKGMKSGLVAFGRLRADVRRFGSVAAGGWELCWARRRVWCSVAAARASALVLGSEAPAMMDARRRASFVGAVDGLSVVVGVGVGVLLVRGVFFLAAVLAGVLTGCPTPRIPF